MRTGEVMAHFSILQTFPERMKTYRRLMHISWDVANSEGFSDLFQIESIVGHQIVKCPSTPNKQLIN